MNEWINSLLDIAPVQEWPRENVNTALDNSAPTELPKTQWWGYDFSVFQEYVAELASLPHISQEQLVKLTNAKLESMWMTMQQIADIQDQAKQDVVPETDTTEPEKITEEVDADKLLDEIESEINWENDITEEEVEQFMVEHEQLQNENEQLKQQIEELKKTWPEEIAMLNQKNMKLEQLLIEKNNQLADMKYSDPFQDTDEAKFINLHRQHKAWPKESTTMALVMTIGDYLNTVTSWKIDSSQLLMMMSNLQRWTSDTQPIYNYQTQYSTPQSTPQPKNSINDLA